VAYDEMEWPDRPVDGLHRPQNLLILHCMFDALDHTNMKRKTDETGSQANGPPESKKRALSTEEATSRFREGLFTPSEQQKYTDAYAKSSPYVFYTS
jgi:hypothetical protein